jgi:transcriptional regulator with XRE-family HTH domain
MDNGPMKKWRTLSAMSTAIRDGIDRSAGLRLRAWLDARPPRAAEIAKEAGVSRQYLGDILAGRVRPSAKVIAACERLGIPTAAIFGAKISEGSA